MGTVVGPRNHVMAYLTHSLRVIPYSTCKYILNSDKFTWPANI
ncbi:hypothetical protein V6Z12_D12G144200 [Gossypium hirsutum]